MYDKSEDNDRPKCIYHSMVVGGWMHWVVLVSRCGYDGVIMRGEYNYVMGIEEYFSFRLAKDNKSSQNNKSYHRYVLPQKILGHVTCIGGGFLFFQVIKMFLSRRSRTLIRHAYFAY